MCFAHHRSRRPLRLVALLLAAAVPAVARADAVDAAYNPMPRPAAQRSARALSSSAAPAALQIRLEPAGGAELETFQQARARARAYMIGFGRQVPVPYSLDSLAQISWTLEPDGSRTALINLTSPGAAAVRAELDLTRIPGRVTLRYLALDEGGQAIGSPSDGRRAPGAAATVWTPLVLGETLGIELHVPADLPLERLALPILQVSHIVSFPLSATAPADASDIGRASACEVDAACSPWSGRDTVKDAVAKITFVEQGGSYLCSGTQLNDQEPGTWTPYLLTAHHCVDSAAAAATLNSFWFFERDPCGGPLADWVQLSGGAYLLDHSNDSDFSLLELAEPAAGGTLFAGWNSDPVADRTGVAGVHHPEGDLKKISLGAVTGTNSCRELFDCGFNDLEVVWTAGRTEPGSSGSGLFEEVSGRLVGNLWGGSSTCDRRGRSLGSDNYGRFSDTYPHVRHLLGAAATALALAPDSEVSAEVTEGGWQDYRVEVPPGVSRLSLTLRDLSADADLYLRKGSKPTSEVYDCVSALGDTFGESCTLGVAQGERVYVGVYGNAPAAFRLTTAGNPQGAWVLPNLWLRAVIDDLEAGPIEAIWKPGGASTTAGGDQVIWGYFYADPARVSWGSPENPALFVKTRLASSGAAQVEYLHAAVPDIQVSSDYPYDGRPDLQSTTRRTSRYLEHSYAGGVTSNGRIRQAIADPLGMRLAAGFGVSLGGGYPGPAADLIGAQWANGLGARPGGYPGRVDPTGVELANDLRIGALIDTAERGPIEAAWRPGGAATTARGDQVVWGYFYADPAQVSGGSPDIPDLFVKVWYDLGGAVDVDFFHLSVRDIEVYSELPNNGSYDHRGVTAPGNRFVEHRYQR